MKHFGIWLMRYFPLFNNPILFHPLHCYLEKKMMLCHLYSEAFRIWNDYCHFWCLDELKHFGICNNEQFFPHNNPVFFRVLHCYLQITMLSKLYAFVQLCYYTTLLCSLIWPMLTIPSSLWCVLPRIQKGQAFPTYHSHTDFRIVTIGFHAITFPPYSRELSCE